ncbi:MAG TPA: flagellar basal body-associated FliL family protein [Aliidongia sp.]|nr:flagellar basal body-associated FliL family protein [Aliidongia sp.]
MADEVTEEVAQPSGEGRKSGKKRLILLIALPVLLLAGTAAGLYFSGVAQVLLGTKKEETAKAEAPPPPPKEAVFYDLPDMLVNLNTGGKKSNFLKISVGLQLESKEDQVKVQAVQARVVDTFQSYLRELRLDDLRGSAGLYRLREELLLRVNAAVSPTKVDDVLFRELLVQ